MAHHRHLGLVRLLEVHLNVDNAVANLVPASAFPPEPIQWLWNGWLAEGKLHILAGSPSTGKTTVALSMAATISVGGAWPDGSRAPKGDVLVWSGEDDFRDTLSPRLMVAGADLDRVRFITTTATTNARERPFDPARDIEPLRAGIAALGVRPRLLIIDPIVSAVAGDSHNNAETRQSLQPLVDLAKDLGCAVVGLSHFTKNTAGKDVLERVTGSIAFGAVARIVLVTGRAGGDRGDERVLVRAKSNIGADGDGVQYILREAPPGTLPAGVTATQVAWGEIIPGTAKEVLAAFEGDPNGQHNSEKADAATAWLKEFLVGAPMPAALVKQHADGAGHAWRTIQRAASIIGVVKSRAGFGGGSTWSLPSSAPRDTVRASPEAVAQMEGHGANESTGIDDRWSEL